MKYKSKCTTIVAKKATQHVAKTKITSIGQANAIDSPPIPKAHKDNSKQVIK